MLPRLHVVTDDAVIAAHDFQDRARAVIEAGGRRIALHVRGHATTTTRLLACAQALRAVSRDNAAWLVVNGRVDVALACDADGLQLGRASLPLPDARTLFGANGVIGYSAHTVDEAGDAVAAGADFVLLGSIWATPSHPDVELAGIGMVASAARTAGAPVLAIGGVSPARIAAVVDAGGYGAAVLGGVWHAADAGIAVITYLDALAAAGVDGAGEEQE